MKTTPITHRLVASVVLVADEYFETPGVEVFTMTTTGIIANGGKPLSDDPRLNFSTDAKYNVPVAEFVKWIPWNGDGDFTAEKVAELLATNGYDLLTLDRASTHPHLVATIEEAHLT